MKVCLTKIYDFIILLILTQFVSKQTQEESKSTLKTHRSKTLTGQALHALDFQRPNITPENFQSVE